MKPQSTNLWDKTLERVGEPIVPLRSWPGVVDCRPSVWCVDSTPVDVVDLVGGRSGFQITFLGVPKKSFNQLLIETADSANPAHSDEMNVVQIRYGLVGPNTASQPILKFSSTNLLR